MSYVIDASAAAEYLLKTSLGGRIANVIEDQPLYAPELLDVEIVSILRRATFRKMVSDRRAGEAIEDLRHWPVERISHRAIAASAWAYWNNVSAYDAFYVAAAVVLDVPLLTADGPLANAPLPGVAVMNVRLGG